MCTALTTVVVAMALTFMWVYEKREQAVGWWCLAMWVGSAATGLLACRGILSFWLTVGLGNALVLFAFGLIWAGFSAFRGVRPQRLLILAGAIAWFAILLLSPDVRGDVNLRIIVSSLLLVGYCVLISWNTWMTWKSERLPTLMAASLFYITHGLFYLARLPLAIYFPVDDIVLGQPALWFGIVSLEAFVHGIFLSFVFVALIRERAERRYRLAAEIDSLTEAATRRHFVAETRAALAAKPAHAVLAVLDLDHFKTINDTYGHMAGDRVLQSFGAHVAAAIRPPMRFGRLGGEEFALFIADTTEDDAVHFLDSVRAGVEALKIPFNGHVLNVTASIGVATTTEAGFDFDHLMAAADNALYACKNAGRNRVLLFTPAMRLAKIVEREEEMRVGLSSGRISRVTVRNAGRP
jgi:diguanylate cyclase (GGDEF)-like protein